MKVLYDDEIEYVPIYNDYDQRGFAEKVLDFTGAILLPLFILGGCWLGGAILLLMIPKSMWLLYWPIRIVRFVGKWGTIIGWPLWFIVEIYGHILRHKENRERNDRLERREQ